jgi:hypothetical protein
VGKGRTTGGQRSLSESFRALAILLGVTFRDRLLATIAAARPVLEVPGVLVVGSEVPNLMEPGAAATLVVSQDLDIGVPVDRHALVTRALPALHAFQQSRDEPSVWTPRDPHLLELNFVGIDANREPDEAFVLEDAALPLLVFGALSMLVPGETLDVAGTRVPLPRLAGLLIEKLVTERTGEKGERDLLVALALISLAEVEDLAEFTASLATLAPEWRHAVASNLTVLSLLSPRAGMPDPTKERDRVAALLSRLRPLTEDRS